MNWSEEELLAYVDHQMAELPRRRLEEALGEDEQLRQRVNALEVSRLPYRAAYARQPVAPLPPALREDVQRLVRAARGKPRGLPRWGWSVAAGVVLLVVFSLGHLTATLFAPPAVELAGDSEDAWVRQVAAYQALYGRETVAGLSADAAAAQAVLQTVPLTGPKGAQVPDLSALGYQFVRAQRLVYEQQPLVQLVYLKAQGRPLALCYMAAEAEDASPVVTRHAGMGTASWRLAGRRFVIVADEPAARLGELQASVQSFWM